MAKKKKEIMLRILMVTEYKGYPLIVQQIKDFYQYIICKDGQWYQGYNVIIPEEGQEELTDKQVASAAFVTRQMAEATIEELIKKADPDYKPTKGEKFAQDVVKALDGLADPKTRPQ